VKKSFRGGGKSQRVKVCLLGLLLLTLAFRRSGSLEKTLAENVVWDLGDLYSGPSDPQIEADTRWLKEQVLAFSSLCLSVETG
jgi:hypothetical protein